MNYKSTTIILILWASKFITCKVLDKQDRKSYPSIHTRVKRKSMIGKANHAHIMCMNAWVKRKSMIEKSYSCTSSVHESSS